MLAAILLFGINCLGQQAAAPAAEPGIQDNSFLVEEAYNQNFGVVQHISSFTRFWNSKDWNYTFTQEWPVPGDERHQLSYTLAAVHSGDFPGSGAGFGDVLLNYRYQLVGSGDTRVAFSPRLSLIFPTGDSSQGTRRRQFRSADQSSLERCSQARNWSATGMWEPHIFRTLRTLQATELHRQVTTWVRALSGWRTLVSMSCWKLCLSGHRRSWATDHTDWTNSLFLSPGIRWSYNFKNGLQIVPGIGVPLGVGPSAGERALFFI